MSSLSDVAGDGPLILFMILHAVFYDCMTWVTLTQRQLAFANWIICEILVSRYCLNVTAVHLSFTLGESEAARPLTFLCNDVEPVDLSSNSRVSCLLYVPVTRAWVWLPEEPWDWGEDQHVEMVAAI